MDNISIPKIIHYCWFGSKMPKKIKKNIEQWKLKLSDYQFIEWNESNFNYHSCEFVKEAYENKKWAFVSDYVRLKALQDYGGIYLDTDVEILKKFDELLEENKLIMSNESERSLCTAVIISNKNNSLITSFLNSYSNKKFVVDGKYQMKPNSELILEHLKNNDIDISYDNECKTKYVHILPQTFLCGKNIFNYKLMITENTYCIHHLDASWYGGGHKLLKKCKKIVRFIINKL